MPHAAEGELHAYLDGALSAIDPDAAERLTAHLERCADCRARLERERVIRDRSTELLGVALPEPADIPPFEVITGTAGDAPSRGGPMWSGRLARAATIVVALGAGWMGHALLRGAGDPARDAALDRVAERPVDSSGAPAETEADRFEGATGERRVAEAPAVTGDADRTRRLANEAEEEALERADPTTEPQPASRDRSAGAPPRQDAGSGSPERREEAPAAEVEIAPQSLELQDSRQVVPAPAMEQVGYALRAGAEDVAALGKAVADASWRPAGEDEAAAWVGRPLLAVADLEVTDISITGTDDLRLVRVRQGLPGGETVEVVLERPRAVALEEGATPEGPAFRLDPDPTSDRAAPDEETAGEVRALPAPATDASVPLSTVRARVDDAWVTVAAPVASDSIRAILSRVRRLERP